MRWFDRLTWNSKNVKRALWAVEKTTDPAKLTRVACGAEEEAAQMAAVKKLDDPARLATVAEKHRYGNVCTAAIGRITDQEVLTGLVNKDKLFDEAYLLAATRVTDQEALQEAYRSHIEKRLERPSTADVYILDRIPDPDYVQQMLYRIATARSLSEETGWKVIERMTDQEALAKIALRHKSPMARMTAAANLEDRAKAREVHEQYLVRDGSAEAQQACAWLHTQHDFQGDCTCVHCGGGTSMRGRKHGTFRRLT